MIKKIYAFGTSHTAGGGFEFNTNNTSPNPDVYKKIIDSENHFDFSYPSILSNKLGIDVENYAKQGYGWERVTRKIFHVLNQKSFKKEESLFLIEISSYDRHEFWMNSIQEHITINALPEEIKNIENFSLAHDYHYQDEKQRKYIENNKNMFHKLMLETLNYDRLLEKIQNNFLLLINFLENNKINYYLTNGDLPISPEHQHFLPDYSNKIIKYKLFDFSKTKYKELENWTEKIANFKLKINDESSNKVNDGHQGLSVSFYIADTIYNKMIDDGYLKSSHIDSNIIKYWEDFKSKLLNVI